MIRVGVLGAGGRQGRGRQKRGPQAQASRRQQGGEAVAGGAPG